MRLIKGAFHWRPELDRGAHTLHALAGCREPQEELLRMLPDVLGEYMLRCHVGMQVRER